VAIRAHAERGEQSSARRAARSLQCRVRERGTGVKASKWLVPRRPDSTVATIDGDVMVAAEATRVMRCGLAHVGTSSHCQLDPVAFQIFKRFIETDSKLLNPQIENGTFWLSKNYGKIKSNRYDEKKQLYPFAQLPTQNRI
jgi:hypothetical protein